MIDFRTPEFKAKYSWPKETGVKSLFRFYGFDPENVDFVRTLFVEKKLFHNTPASFNDPFECKPHFQWPTNALENGAFIEDVIALLSLQGVPHDKAMLFGMKALTDRTLQDELVKTIVAMLQTFRICCFTTRKENLLFWSHYAGSHQGYCVEFDTQYPIFAQAYRVRYSSSYPVLKFPLFNGLLQFSKIKKGDDIEEAVKDLKIDFGIAEPVLNKSEEWRYEDEYRSLMMPDAPLQLENDGTCAQLQGSEIKNIYFGCKMPLKHREQLMQIVREGEFKPGFWQASMQPDQFALSFKPVR